MVWVLCCFVLLLLLCFVIYFGYFDYVYFVVCMLRGCFAFGVLVVCIWVLLFGLVVLVLLFR